MLSAQPGGGFLVLSIMLKSSDRYEKSNLLIQAIVRRS